VEKEAAGPAGGAKREIAPQRTGRMLLIYRAKGKIGAQSRRRKLMWEMEIIGERQGNLLLFVGRAISQRRGGRGGQKLEGLGSGEKKAYRGKIMKRGSFEKGGA